MTALRTVTVHTRDHGEVTFTEPRWCVHSHDATAFRADIAHISREYAVHIRTPRGVMELLSLVLAERPYSELPGGTGLHLGVCLAEGEAWESQASGVLLLAVRLVFAAGRIPFAALRVSAARLRADR